MEEVTFLDAMLPVEVVELEEVLDAVWFGALDVIDEAAVELVLIEEVVMASGEFVEDLFSP